MATNATQGSQNTREKEKIPLTREGFEEKKARLHYLETVRRHEVADYIHEAKEAGDVSESSAYEDAKNLQAMVEGEIQELRHLLEHAVVLETPEETGGPRMVRLGSTVDVDRGSGSALKFMLVSTAEANSGQNNGVRKISDQSPVGKALLGHTEGDRVEVSTPNGVVTYSIRAIH